MWATLGALDLKRYSSVQKLLQNEVVSFSCFPSTSLNLLLLWFVISSCIFPECFLTALRERAWTCWVWSVSFMCHMSGNSENDSSSVYNPERLEPLMYKKTTMCCDYCNVLLKTLQWYKMVGLKEALALSISETKTWCLLLMPQTGEIFSAIRLHCWCWRCLNLTSCHLYRASYLWRIRKLHHQTRKWTQKCKVHSQKLFSCVFASSFC